MRNSSPWRNVAVIATLAASFSVAHAVDVNGRIRGSVTDPGGAVLPNAQVTATNKETGVKFTTTSQANGDYLFPQLPVGTYTITATAPGFKTFTATGILLTIDQEYVETVKLDVGDTTENVEVAADTVQVNTTDMQLNNIVNAAQMEELPLIGRNFTGLELTLPGVQGASDRFGTASVSGAQSQQSSFLINGADTNDISLNTLTIAPNLDAIDQFNLIDGPLNAEYDRNSGGIVSATIKQGTNHIHGDVFEFYRDTFLNTNNFYQKTFTAAGVRTDKVAKYHQNIFGGTIGAPIFKDKFFIFGAYQGTRQAVPESTASNTVYTTAQRNGDFSNAIGTPANGRPNSPGPGVTNTTYGSFSAKYIPSTVQIAGCTQPLETYAQCAYDLKGDIPTSAFNSVSSKLLTYVPTPPSGTNTFSYNATSGTTQNQYLGRVDYNYNPRNQFTVVGIYQSAITSNDLPFTGATVPGFGDGSLSHIQQYTADYVHQFSSSAVNDLAAHYTRFNFNSGAPQKVVAPSTAGFAITPQDPSSETLPKITVGSGSAGFTLGGTNNGPQPRIDQVIQFDDNFTKTLGHHNLKFGYDGRRFNVSNTFDANNSGSFSFQTSGTFSSGVPLLDFLLGVPSSFAQGSGSVIQADAFLNYLYGQDSWKVANTFTLNYGVGYSIDTPLRNHQLGGLAVSCLTLGQQSKIFPTAPIGLNYPGDPGCTNSGQAYTRYTEVGPRIGFAWAPDLGFISGSPGKFSVRGGFGIYYNRSEEETALQTLGTPPFGLTSAGITDIGGKPQFANPYADINGGVSTPVNGVPGKPLASATIPNKFPYVAPTAGTPVDFSPAEPIAEISSFDKSFRAPYSENFQISVERELPSRLVARVSYVGALGRHEQTTYEGIPETAAGHAACLADPVCIANAADQQALYPNHTVGNNANFVEIGEVGSYGSSNYNSLQVGLTKAPTHGLIFQLSYTYSHSLDDGSSFENSGFGSNGTAGTSRGYNQYVKSLNYGNSAFDGKHRFVFSPVYVTPTFKSHNAFSPINLGLSGWEISGILTLATGLPYDISYAGFDTSNSLYCSIDYSFYACPDIPVQTGALVRSNPRVRPVSGPTRYFQVASFTDEPIGSFGNVQRNPYHGPGTNNTNLILAKNFNVTRDGTRRLQLRMESDNVFNHTQFNNPTGTYDSGLFGEITSAASGRQTQLAAKFYF
jgi:hypothetical protein